MQHKTAPKERFLITAFTNRFLSAKVSQGNIAIRLRCDEIFNDLLIANLLLSQTVKEF